LERMEAHSARASQHRLNQQPKNASLQKASQVNEAMAALRRQNRTETLNIFLSIYLCPPDKSKAPKKVCKLYTWYDGISVFISLPVSHSIDCHPP